jgi:maltose alpha-D-glucosyltransferase/alpha-amylase
MMAVVVPVLHAADPAQVLSAATLGSLESNALRTYLGGRRWFGAKGRAMRSVEVEAVIPVTWDSAPRERYAIALLRLELEDGTVLRYQLPVAAVQGTDPLAEQALALVDSDGSQTQAVIDATLVPAFRRGLGAAFRTGAEFTAAGRTWRIERVGDPGVELPDESRVVGAEQSNTSMIYGAHAICKLFRRLEPGENPDVEISRFLSTRTGFRNTPHLLGVMHLEDSKGRSVAGMLSRFQPESQDAWAYAVARANAYLGAEEEAQGASAFASDARELGAVTRALHEALSSDENDPEFAPAFATDEDVERWTENALALLADGMAILAARVDALEGQTQAHARALVKRRAELENHVRGLADRVIDSGDPGMRIRHHGDYHLGQVLRTREGGWMIIDFEGEPARPLEERRARHSPLRDVAGMMRSFAYAAATGAMNTGGVGRDPRVEIRAARWEREVRQHFMSGYLAGVGAGADALLPATADGTAALLELLEAEKLFYELGYELDNRPAWTWIPLRGIAKLL